MKRTTHGSGFIAAALLAAITALAPLSASADGPIRFAIQAWPGVTVKTQVATKLLNAMGYKTTIEKLDPQFVYQGIRSNDVDVSLGAWMPAHKDMLQPLLDDGVAKEYAANLTGAVQGLAVPETTYKKGIHTIKDLAAHGDMFDHKIYAIGAGAAMTRAFQKAVKDNYEGLGGWKVVPSSTSGMMAQVKRATNRHEAIVFHGWKPHWMDVVYNIRFLKDDNPDSKIADLKTTVYTVTRTGWAENNPQPAKFLKQFKVPVSAQSQWINGFAHHQRDPDTVSTNWIKKHMDQVAQWVDGVKTADGGSGVQAIRAQFGG